MGYNCAQVVAANSSRLAVDSLAVLPNASKFTLAFWFKFDVLSGYSPIFRKEGGGQDFNFLADGMGNVSFYYAGGILINIGTVVAGVWNHFAITWDNTTGHAVPYLNAVAGTSTACAGPYDANYLEFGYNSETNQFASGRLCEGAIWQGQVLSGAEITDLYSLGASGVSIHHYADATPSTYWDFATFVGGMFDDVYSTYPLDSFDANFLVDSVVTHEPGTPVYGLGLGTLGFPLGARLAPTITATIDLIVSPEATFGAPAPIDYGTDVDTMAGPVGVFQLDPGFGLISGPPALAQRLARLCMTPLGSLVFYPGRTTIDLRVYANSKINDGELTNLKSIVETIFEEDDEVDDALCIPAYNFETRTMSFHGSVTPSLDDPFPFVMSITALNVSIIIPPVAGD